MEEKKRQLVERLGIIFEREGKSAVGGRIMGLFLTSSQDLLTFDQIVEELQLSKSAVSNGINLLLNLGHLDYTKKTGERKRYFRLCPRDMSAVFGEFMDNMMRFKEALEEIYDEESIGTEATREQIRHMLTGLMVFKEFMPVMLEEYNRRIREE